MFLSELEAVAQALLALISNANASIVEVNVCSKQVNQMFATANKIMQGTEQCGFQEMIGLLLVSQKKLEYAEKCLIRLTNVGNNWLECHFGSTHPTVINGAIANNSTDTATNPEDDPLKPTRKTPRDLPVTQYGFSQTSNGMEVYDSPLEVDKYLYAEQGSAYDKFQGTCGLCSIVNILRLAGVNIGEKEVIDYAVNTQGSFFSPKLCTVNPFNSDESGGTTPKQRQKILDYFGISSSIWNVKLDVDGRTSIDTINDIAKWISEGRGVIVDVDAGLFYNSPKNNGKGHAVTITSVEKNKYGDVTAFYILDSNQGTVKYNAWEIQDILRSFVGINVTSQIIR